MEIVSIIIGVLSLCGTCFLIGYQIGKDSHRNNANHGNDNNTQQWSPVPSQRIAVNTVYFIKRTDRSMGSAFL